MSKTHANGGAITSRGEFEAALETLVRSASDNGVGIEGAYAVQGDDSGDVSIRISESDRFLDRSESPSTTNRHSGEQSVTITTRADLRQVLTGLRLTRDSCDGACSGCGRRLGDGEILTATAVKPIEDDRWLLRGIYCRECSSSELESYRFGRAEVLFDATVTEALTASKQTGWRILSDVLVLEYSPPTEGVICP